MMIQSPPSGFPNFSPKTERIHQNWKKIITQTFERYGFAMLETSVADKTANIAAKGADDKEIYVLERLHAEKPDVSLENNKKLPKVALRFDHTIPLALYVARNQQNLAFPFFRGAIGPVFRGERPQKGRFRQFTQCDVDIIGKGDNFSVEYDAQVLLVMIDALKKLNIGDFCMKISHRGLLQGFLEHLQVKIPFADVLRVIDQKEKLEKDAWQEKLAEIGLKSYQINDISDFIESETIPEYLINTISPVKFKNETFLNAKAKITKLFEILNQNSVQKWVKLDLSIARGLDYYTGMVAETHLVGKEHLGSICSGGRYANLTQKYTKGAFPGVGMSIGLTRLLSVLEDELILDKKQGRSSTKVVLCSVSEDQKPLVEGIKQDLQKNKVACVVLAEKKLKNVFSYAEKAGITWVGIVGENEAKNGTISLKNVVTGEKLEEKTKHLADFLQKRV